MSTREGRKQVNVRLDHETYEILVQSAERFGGRYSRSELVRMVMRNEIGKLAASSGGRLSVDEREEIAPALGGVMEKLSDIRANHARMGSNLNQIAKAVNSGHQVMPAHDLDEYKREAIAIKDELDRLVGEVQEVWRLFE